MTGAAAALRGKYERMRRLRAAAERAADDAAADDAAADDAAADATSAGPTDADAAAMRAELRALAAEWPGALKELDTLPTDELERRAALCAAGGDGEPWMAWMLRYHQLMRAALAVRRGATPSADDGAVDEAFLLAVRRPAHGRLNVVVFATLAREVGVEARTLWDTLFPRRGKAPRAYR